MTKPRFGTLQAVAAELVGVSQRALDITVDYVKQRKQFGVPVGSFQAVGHRCAQMLLRTEGARSAAYFAAWAADAAPERLAEASALAKAAASEAGREVTASAIQAHGGIGFTWERTSTGCSNARRSTPRCSAGQASIARGWRDSWQRRWRRWRGDIGPPPWPHSSGREVRSA